MSKVHKLKTDPLVFEEVVQGRKTHEVRYNDRNFQVGDTLLLEKTKYSSQEMLEGAPLEYTGATFTCAVTHVLSGYGLQEGWVVLSIK